MATLTGGRGWASDACAASVHRLDSAFGRILPIASAGRSWSEQNEAYQRYKSGRGPLALPPGTSIHEQGNAIDWGNAVYGLLGLHSGLGWRGLTINRHGHRRTVSSEVWHTEYAVNEDNFRGQGAPAGVGGGDYAAPVREIQELANKLGANLVVDGDYGPSTAGWVRAFQGDHGLTIDGIVGPATWAKMKEVWNNSQQATSPYDQYGGATYIRSVQEKANRLGAKLTVDGQDGPATQGWVRAFQGDHGLTVDGVAGPVTVNKMDSLLAPAPVGRNASSRSTYDVQRKLIEKGYDLGSYGADGDYGQATTNAVIKFQRDNGLEPDGVYGPQTDEKLFSSAPVPETPSTKYPTNGRNATTRPTKDIQKLVGVEADGAYGPNTSQAVAKWQEKNRLDADGIWGPASDAKGFPGVALPDAPADPTQSSTYGKKIPTYPDAIWADVSSNKSVREGTVKLFVIHHIAAPSSTNEGNRKRFMSTNDRSVSPNWYVQSDGGVSEIVPPDDYRAWTGGAVDHQAVTVETQNTSGAPAWGISPESHEAIANLVAWSAHRYGFPIQRGSVSLVNGKNVVNVPGVLGHRDTPAGKETITLCPGPSMNIDWIISRANEIYQAKYVVQPTPTPEPEPETPQEPAEPTIPTDMVLVPRQFFKDLTAELSASIEEAKKYLG